jgi:hypothetical protein
MKPSYRGPLEMSNFEPKIRYNIDGRRKKQPPCKPIIQINGHEFTSDYMTLREAKEICRALISTPYEISEEFGKLEFEPVDLRDVETERDG